MVTAILNYVPRHWRGELRLATTWWVNCIGLTVGLILLVSWLTATGRVTFPPSAPGFAWSVAFTGVPVLLVPLWQMVGLWRATTRHLARGGPIVTGRGTQAMAVIFTLLIAMRALTWTAEQVITSRVAFAFGSYAYVVTLLPGGREVEIRGGLGYGVSDDLADVLARSPMVRRVRLNSGGGALSEGRRLRELIRSHHLDTYTSTGCASACVSAYIGGRFRYLQRGARIGLHLPRNWQPLRVGGVNPAYAAELMYFRRLGLPDWFLIPWMKTGQKMWHPPVIWLRRAGLVSFLRGPGNVEHSPPALPQ